MRPATSTDGLRFGGFVVDLRQRTFSRRGVRIKLHGQPFEILLLLLERPGEVVTREELQRKLWTGGTFVDFENGLNAAVKKLRLALGDSAEMPRYIETVPRVGYRFVARVRVLGDPSTGELDNYSDDGVSASGGRLCATKLQSVSPENRESTSEPIVEPLLPQSTTEPSCPVYPPPAAVSQSSAAPRPARPATVRRALMALLASLGLALTTFVALRSRIALPAPHVTRIRQITNLGTVAPSQNLAVVGSHLYFAVIDGTGIQIRSVSLDGSALSYIPRPFPASYIELHGTGSSANELLIGRFESGFPSGHSVWTLPVSAGIPHRVGRMFLDDAAWSPDGHTIAYTHETDQTLNLMDGDYRNPRMLAHVPGIPFDLRWSPDGKLIRFSVLDTKAGGIRIWQIDVSGENLTRLDWGWSDSSRAWTGRWTPDGRYFLFTGSQEGPKNVWALPERKGILGTSAGKPVRLTEGPLSYSMVALGPDGRTLYTIGTERRGQLVRYDPRSRQFESYPADISGDQVTFSPDGQWLAYISYPDRTLIKSRPDGSQRLQLTFPPMGAFKPSWSPDGRRIAFSAYRTPDKPNKIYVVSARGGPPRLLMPGTGTDQDSPVWSADGRFLLFSSSDESRHWTMHRFNVETGADKVLPGTLGFGYEQVSPDGKFVAAEADRGLVLYETASHRTRSLAQITDYPVWSADGKYIYYNNLMQAALIGTEQVGIFRVRVRDGKIERLASSPNFPLAGNYGVWTGLAPDGSILLLREVGTSDVYALDVDFR